MSRNAEAPPPTYPFSGATLGALIYEAIYAHRWKDGRCSCGWKKPPHSIGHKHHLANLAACAVEARLNGGAA